MERLDHILIRVENLEESIIDFQKAGFNVFYGTSPSKAYNAMIYFQDQSFIELLDPTKFPSIIKIFAKTKLLRFFNSFYQRVGRYTLSSERLLDFAVYSSEINKLYSKNRKTSSPLLKKMKRVNHKGDTLNWDLFSPKKLILPFIISDYSPYKYSGDEAINHKNGIKGISKIKIQTNKNIKELKKEIELFFHMPEDTITLSPNSLEILTGNSLISYTIENQKYQIILKKGISNFDNKLEKYKITTNDKD